MMVATVVDQRARTEQDVDFQRVQRATLHKLQASVATFVADLRRGVTASVAQSQFIHRTVTALVSGYHAAFEEGAADYAERVSAQPKKLVARLAAKPGHVVQRDRMARQALTFFTPSVAKMAAEGVVAWQAEQSGAALSETVRLDAGNGRTVDYPPLRQWQQGADVRLKLQADVTWAGFQAGYVTAGTFDTAKPYIKLWWMLDPGAKHCEDCPMIAAKNPYDPPGGAFGANTLGQTPGDGGTACGANCKCDLEYGPPGDANYVDWAGAWPVNTPLQTLWPEAFPPMTLGLPGSKHLTTHQKSALDQWRQADALWDRYRGNLPPLPDMFDPEEGAVDFRKLNWDKLTEKQREALVWALEALGYWIDAGGGQQV